MVGCIKVLWEETSGSTSHPSSSSIEGGMIYRFVGYSGVMSEFWYDIETAKLMNILGETLTYPGADSFKREDIGFL